MSDFDQATTEDLLNIALTSPLGDESEGSQGWQAIWALQKRGTAEVFEECQALCEGDDPYQRLIGVTILGQLGWQQEYPFREMTVSLMLNMIAHDQDPTLLNAVGVALGHLHDAGAIGPLMRLTEHLDPVVRTGVVFGLLGYEDEQAIHTLISLTSDPDPAVRDWATFGLGSMLEADTEPLRQALLARLDDPDDTTRGEAMVGLAKRKDERVVEPLLAELGTLRFWTLSLEAAEALADPRLLPALLRLRANWRDDQNSIFWALEDAIVACGGRRLAEGG